MSFPHSARALPRSWSLCVLTMWKTSGARASSRVLVAAAAPLTWRGDGRNGGRVLGCALVFIRLDSFRCPDAAIVGAFFSAVASVVLNPSSPGLWLFPSGGCVRVMWLWSPPLKLGAGCVGERGSCVDDGVELVVCERRPVDSSREVGQFEQPVWRGCGGCIGGCHGVFFRVCVFVFCNVGSAYMPTRSPDWVLGAYTGCLRGAYIVVLCRHVGTYVGRVCRQSQPLWQ